jgi:hypothetical protein
MVGGDRVRSATAAVKEKTRAARKSKPSNERDHRMTGKALALMPQEQERKSCSFQGCRGTMTFSSQAMLPGGMAGFSGEGGRIVWGADREPGWVCNREHDHFEPITPN